MRKLKRDEKGIVIPYDDDEIQSGDGLYRYIDPENHLVDDENKGRKRVSSGAFSESRGPNAPYGGMSVDLERLMVEAGVSYMSRLINNDWGVVRLFVGELRELKCQVGRDPIEADPRQGIEENPQHGLVWGIQKKLRKKNSKKKIMNGFDWVKKAKGVS